MVSLSEILSHSDTQIFSYNWSDELVLSTMCQNAIRKYLTKCTTVKQDQRTEGGHKILRTCKESC